MSLSRSLRANWKADLRRVLLRENFKESLNKQRYAIYSNTTPAKAQKGGEVGGVG